MFTLSSILAALAATLGEAPTGEAPTGEAPDAVFVLNASLGSFSRSVHYHGPGAYRIELGVGDELIALADSFGTGFLTGLFADDPDDVLRKLRETFKRYQANDGELDQVDDDELDQVDDDELDQANDDELDQVDDAAAELRREFSGATEFNNYMHGHGHSGIARARSRSVAAGGARAAAAARRRG